MARCLTRASSLPIFFNRKTAWQSACSRSILPRAVCREHPTVRSSSTHEATAQSFDGAEKAATFAAFFEAGAPMWAKMSMLAEKQKPEPTNILDLGCGPGEPACHFAAKFPGVPVTASDLAPSMIDLAKQRVEAKGLDNVECMVLDMQDQSAIADASVDLVISQMTYQFAPDKPKALAETFRVLKPGGVLIANVWVAFDLIPMAGGLMAAVTGPPKEAPPPNPNGPLGLSDQALFDSLLKEAGFELTTDHNYFGTEKFVLGPSSSDVAFKMATLPIWDKFVEFEKEGTFPDAWATAKAAFPGIAKPYEDATSGDIILKGTFCIAVAKKP